MKPGKLKIDLSALERLAQAMFDEHADLTGRGFTMTNASGFWLTARGDVTARFVYRRAGGPSGQRSSATLTMRGLRLAWQ